MHTKLLEKLGADARITQAVKKTRKQGYLKLGIYGAFVLALAVILPFACKLDAWGWGISLFIAALAILLPLFVYIKKKPQIFCGKVEKMEEDRKVVPQKGTAAFGRFHMHTAEVYQLVIAITDESHGMQVLYCPSQYEKIIAIGDTLLYHSALPYPAHLSNPTKCICMHCGTMQSSSNQACITCGADLYTVYTVTENS